MRMYSLERYRVGQLMCDALPKENESMWRDARELVAHFLLHRAAKGSGKKLGRRRGVWN